MPLPAPVTIAVRPADSRRLSRAMFPMSVSRNHLKLHTLADEMSATRGSMNDGSHLCRIPVLQLRFSVTSGESKRQDLEDPIWAASQVNVFRPQTQGALRTSHAVRSVRGRGEQ